MCFVHFLLDVADDVAFDPSTSDSSNSLPSQSVFNGSSNDISERVLVVSPQVHENFVFDAAGRVRGQLDLLAGIEGVDGFNEADGADGH